MSALDEEINFLDEDLTEVHTEQLETDIRYKSTAMPGVLYQMILGELSVEKIRAAARAGSIWGINLSRTDAILDGERGFDSIEQANAFSENYLKAFDENCIPSPVENDFEKSAYRAAN